MTINKDGETTITLNNGTVISAGPSNNTGVWITGVWYPWQRQDTTATIGRDDGRSHAHSSTSTTTPPIHEVDYTTDNISTIPITQYHNGGDDYTGIQGVNTNTATTSTTTSLLVEAIVTLPVDGTVTSLDMTSRRDSGHISADESSRALTYPSGGLVTTERNIGHNDANDDAGTKGVTPRYSPTTDTGVGKRYYLNGKWHSVNEEGGVITINGSSIAGNSTGFWYGDEWIGFRTEHYDNEMLSTLAIADALNTKRIDEASGSSRSANREITEIAFITDKNNSTRTWHTDRYGVTFRPSDFGNKITTDNTTPSQDHSFHKQFIYYNGEWVEVIIFVSNSSVLIHDNIYIGNSTGYFTEGEWIPFKSVHYLSVYFHGKWHNVTLSHDGIVTLENKQKFTGNSTGFWLGSNWIRFSTGNRQVIIDGKSVDVVISADGTVTIDGKEVIGNSTGFFNNGTWVDIANSSVSLEKAKELDIYVNGEWLEGGIVYVNGIIVLSNSTGFWWNSRWISYTDDHQITIAVLINGTLVNITMNTNGTVDINSNITFYNSTGIVYGGEWIPYVAAETTTITISTTITTTTNKVVVTTTIYHNGKLINVTIAQDGTILLDNGTVLNVAGVEWIYLDGDWLLTELNDGGQRLVKGRAVTTSNGTGLRYLGAWYTYNTTAINRFVDGQWRRILVHINGSVTVDGNAYSGNHTGYWITATRWIHFSTIAHTTVLVNGVLVNVTTDSSGTVRVDGAEVFTNGSGIAINGTYVEYETKWVVLDGEWWLAVIRLDGTVSVRGHLYSGNSSGYYERGDWVNFVYRIVKIAWVDGRPVEVFVYNNGTTVSDTGDGVTDANSTGVLVNGVWVRYSDDKNTTIVLEGVGGDVIVNKDGDIVADGKVIGNRTGYWTGNDTWVSFKSDDHSTKTTAPSTLAQLTSNTNVYVINGVTYAMDTPLIVNGTVIDRQDRNSTGYLINGNWYTFKSEVTTPAGIPLGKQSTSSLAGRTYYRRADNGSVIINGTSVNNYNDTGFWYRDKWIVFDDDNLFTTTPMYNKNSIQITVTHSQLSKSPNEISTNFKSQTKENTRLIKEHSRSTKTITYNPDSQTIVSGTATIVYDINHSRVTFSQRTNINTNTRQLGSEHGRSGFKSSTPITSTRQVNTTTPEQPSDGLTTPPPLSPSTNTSSCPTWIYPVAIIASVLLLAVVSCCVAYLIRKLYSYRHSRILPTIVTTECSYPQRATVAPPISSAAVDYQMPVTPLGGSSVILGDVARHINARRHSTADMEYDQLSTSNASTMYSVLSAASSACFSASGGEGDGFYASGQLASSYSDESALARRTSAGDVVYKIAEDRWNDKRRPDTVNFVPDSEVQDGDETRILVNLNLFQTKMT